MKKLGTFSALFLLAFSLQWLGAWTNQAVVAANNGTMPVWIISDYVAHSVAGDDSHSPLTWHSHYILFCDIFPVPLFHGAHIGLEISSLGDVALDVGSYLFLILPFLVPYWATKGIVTRRNNGKK